MTKQQKMRLSPRYFLLSIFLVLSLAFSACGDGDEPEAGDDVPVEEPLENEGEEIEEE